MHPTVASRLRRFTELCRHRLIKGKDAGFGRLFGYQIVFPPVVTMLKLIISDDAVSGHNDAGCKARCSSDDANSPESPDQPTAKPHLIVVLHLRLPSPGFQRASAASSSGLSRISRPFMRPVFDRAVVRFCDVKSFIFDVIIAETWRKDAFKHFIWH
jgi:hypothetical protein